MNKEVNREKLHLAIDKFGLMHPKTIEISQELDLEVVEKQRALWNSDRVVELYRSGVKVNKAIEIVKVALSDGGIE